MIHGEPRNTVFIRHIETYNQHIKAAEFMTPMLSIETLPDIRQQYQQRLLEVVANGLGIPATELDTYKTEFDEKLAKQGAVESFRFMLRVTANAAAVTTSGLDETSVAAIIEVDHDIKEKVQEKISQVASLISVNKTKSKSLRNPIW